MLQSLLKPPRMKTLVVSARAGGDPLQPHHLHAHSVDDGLTGGRNLRRSPERTDALRLGPGLGDVLMLGGLTPPDLDRERSQRVEARV